MMRFIKRLCTARFLPITWTLLIIILLCLPGSTIPGDGVFSIPDLDKAVHVLLFGGFVIGWGFNLYFRRADTQKWRKTIIMLTVCSICLGIVLEFLQLWFIPNRSFDGMDIVADSAGALLAGLFHISVRVR